MNNSHTKISNHSSSILAIESHAKKWIAILGRSLWLTFAWSLTAFAAANNPDIPQHGNSLQSFVPLGYEIGIEVSGDFNGDGRKDIAVLLWVSPNSTNVRPLIILLGQVDGTYRLTARTDHFSNPEENMCGAGNFNCIPQIRAEGRALIIGMAWGSAAGYQVQENEFRLIEGSWYQVGQAEYELGVDLTCSGSNAEHEGERCVEQGISRNLSAGIATKYCKFVNEDGKETRTQRTESSFAKSPLILLTEVEWDSAEQ